MIVEQLGLEITPLFLNTSSGLISGTTRGTFSSNLNALELSINTAPALTISSLNSLATAFEAAPKTISKPANASWQANLISTSLPAKGTFFPTDLSLANNLN